MPVFRATLPALKQTKESAIVRPESITADHKKGYADGFLAAIEQVESLSFDMVIPENFPVDQAMKHTRNTIVRILRGTHELFEKDTVDAASS